MADRFDDDRHCFVCGEKNDFGLRLSPRGEGGRSIIEWTPDARHQGFADVVHGGLISTILYDAMAYAAMSAAGFCATANISVKFKKPVRTGIPLKVLAEVVQDRGRIIRLKAEVTQEGETRAEGEATFIKVPGEIRGAGD